MFRAKEGRPPAVAADPGLPGAGSQLDGVRVLDDDRPPLGRDRSSRLAGLMGPLPTPLARPGGRLLRAYMHAAKDRADAMAKRSADSAGRDPGDGETLPGEPVDERLASRRRDATSSPLPRRSRRTTDPVRDDTIQVTLGPPEPLPALAATRNTDLAWNDSTPQPEGQAERPPDEAARPPLHGSAASPWLAAILSGMRRRRDRPPLPSVRLGLLPTTRAPSWPGARPSCDRSTPTRSRSRGPSASAASSSPRNRSS